MGDIAHGGLERLHVGAMTDAFITPRTVTFTPDGLGLELKDGLGTMRGVDAGPWSIVDE